MKLYEKQFGGVILSTNQITHNNHYVPQFYLKNWSQDGNSIFVYNLLVSDSRIPYWGRKKIKSTAVWYEEQMEAEARLR